MSERLPESAELEPLWLDEVWDEALGGEDPTWRDKFAALKDATRAAADPVEHPWAFDEPALERRWKRIINHIPRQNLPSSISDARQQPSAEVLLHQSFAAVDDSLEKYGWVTPGFGITLLEGGFAWYLTKGHNFDPI